MKRTFVAAVVISAGIAASVATAASRTKQDPLDDRTLRTIRSRFSELIELANRHDLKALHGMFWQSPSVLLVAKSAIPSEGNWAGYWGNDAVDRKLRDIAASGPVFLAPDFSRLKVVGLTDDVAESYVPLTITVSYAGQDGNPKPFLMVINWIKVAKNWKVASEIIVPVPSAPLSANYKSRNHDTPILEWRLARRIQPPTNNAQSSFTTNTCGANDHPLPIRYFIDAAPVHARRQHRSRR